MQHVAWWLQLAHLSVPQGRGADRLLVQRMKRVPHGVVYVYDDDLSAFWYQLIRRVRIQELNNLVARARLQRSMRLAYLFFCCSQTVSASCSCNSITCSGITCFACIRTE